MTRYAIPMKNTGEKNLDKVVLKEYEKPQDLIMNDFELLDGLASGKTNSISLAVIVKRGDFITQEKSWTVNFTMRAEKGSFYLEQGGFYHILALKP